MLTHEFMHEMQATSKIFGRKHGISVVFKGDQAGTDGKQIFLPALPLSKELTPAQVRAMRGYVDHEAGHIRHSDMPRIMDFYDRCINNGKSDLKNLHNVLEDIWMEDKVIKDYPGSSKNLKQTNELVKGKELEGIAEAKKETGKNPLDETSVQTAGLAISTLGRDRFKGDNCSEVMGMIPDTLKDHAKGWVDEALKCKNSEDVITLAKSVYKLLKEDDPNLDKANPEDFDPESGKDMEEGEKPEENEGGEGSPEDGGEGEVEELELSKEMAEALSELEGKFPGGIGQKEGDYKGEYRVYSTEYDREYHRGSTVGYEGFSDYDTYHKETINRLNKAVNSIDSSKYEQIKSQISGSVLTMKSKLRRALMARQNRDWEGGREEGKLDNKKLVSAYLGSKTVFKRRVSREEEDTVITLLVDLSGSMISRDKIKVARDCVVAFAECLEGTGFKYNIVGFCNNDCPDLGTRTMNKYHRVETLDTVFFKEFDTPLRVSKGSISSIPKAVGHNNSDYDFIVNAANSLVKRPESRKVLLVLSDGYPECDGGADGNELARHCKNAVRHAKKKGVECVGIGILSDAVEKIYDDHVVVHDVKDLSSSVFNKLTGLLLDGSKTTYKKGGRE